MKHDVRPNKSKLPREPSACSFFLVRLIVQKRKKDVGTRFDFREKQALLINNWNTPRRPSILLQVLYLNGIH
jgi:hypothetical protein